MPNGKQIIDLNAGDGCLMGKLTAHSAPSAERTVCWPRRAVQSGDSESIKIDQIILLMTNASRAPCNERLEAGSASEADAVHTRIGATRKKASMCRLHKAMPQ